LTSIKDPLSPALQNRRKGEVVLFAGQFDLPWWAVLVALLLTHITIVAVTVFLNRHQAHRAVDLHCAEKLLRAHERARLAELLPKSPFLQTMVAMRHELVGLWARSMATREQLVGQLQDSCRRAETSEIKPLAEFSRQLRCYA
jgi:hypothetical protein